MFRYTIQCPNCGYIGETNKIKKDNVGCFLFTLGIFFLLLFSPLAIGLFFTALCYKLILKKKPIPLCPQCKNELVIVTKKELNILIIPLVGILLLISFTLLSFFGGPSNSLSKNLKQNNLEKKELPMPNTPSISHNNIGTTQKEKIHANENEIEANENTLNDKLRSHGLDSNLYGVEQKMILVKGIETGVNVHLFSDPRFSPEQMQEILLGLQKGLDVTKYNKTIYSPNMMKQIRETLELGN
ncbi:MAG TPA: hypothetical protein PLJ10_09100 [Candidatus Hydrogenedens sp.]|nr:hypothetical protein [Candidatus Hydrogenedens sp.]